MGSVGAAAELEAVESGSTLTRLKASSDRLAVLEDERRTEQRRRDQLVVMARDEGSSWRTIASAARCSMSRCVAIVGGG